jgi:hypothetical protein
VKAVPARRRPSGDDHDFEPAYGLPEALPAGEKILWQGSPDWRGLARRAFHTRKLVVYFAALALLRVVLMADDTTLVERAVAGGWIALLGATAIGLLSLMAWLTARATVYTVTDKRVVMRIGIVLSLSFNIPFSRIVSAGLRLDADGSGDLPLVLDSQDRIAWLHLWPHARPWRLARPEPMLRSVPNAAAVAQRLSDAWSLHTGQSASAETAAPAPQRSDAGPTQPALATG